MSCGLQLRIVCMAFVAGAVTMCHAQSGPGAQSQALRHDKDHDKAGRLFLAQKDWKAALAEFQQALQLTPASADAHIGAGIAFWGLGDHKSALAEFQRATDSNPNSAEAHYNIGIAFRDFGENERAAAELRAALKLKPGYEQAEIMLGLLLQQGGEPDKAIAQYRALLRRNPRSAEGHNWLGVAYLQKNLLPEAEAEFREAIKLKADYVRAYNNLGSTLAQAGDIAQGVQALEQGLKYAPGDLEMRINLGMALRSKGDADAALMQFRSLLNEHSDSPELEYQYGQTLRQKGDLPGAIEAFEKALERNPEAHEPYYGLGQALKEVAAQAKRSRGSAAVAEYLKTGSQALARGDYSEVRDRAERAIGGDPDSAEAHQLLGIALWYSGDRVRSATELAESLRFNPAAGNAYGFLGMIDCETGDLDGARKMLQRAIALVPQAPQPYLDLGIVFLRQGRLDRAVGQFEAGLNLPDAPRSVPDLDAAVRELRQAISHNPDAAEAYSVLGRLLGAAGADAAQVIAAFQEAIRLRPEDPEARNYLGLVYVQTGDDERAIAAFREAVKLRPDYADAHQNLGAVLTTSDAAAAVRELQIAVKLQPALLKAQYNLALAYEASPQHGPAKAIEQLRKVIAADARYSRAEYALGRVLLRQNRMDEAIDHLRRAVEQEPAFGEARYQLGLALSRSGRAEEGAAEIRKSREIITANESEQAAGLDLAAAKMALEQGDFETAIAKARKVVTFRPDAVEANAVLAAALSKKGKTEESPQGFERYIREGKFTEAEGPLRAYLGEHPKSARAWYMLGYSLYAQRKIGESIKALAQSLQIDVSNGDAHKVLGRDLMMIGRFDAAKIEFEQGAQLNPKSAEMPYNLGKLFSIQDNWADARHQFEKAIRIDSEYMEAYDGLGFALEALGDDTGAAANYKKAIEMTEARHSGFAAPYINMSALLNRMGDRTAALDYAGRALQANPNSDRALFQMAKAHEYEGDLNTAVEELKRAIAINSHSSSYFYVLSTVYRKLGKTDDSRKAMEKFSALDRESSDLEQKRREFLKEEAQGRHD
jgi:tetratricopeptide (TPR) repeat protein